METIRADGTGTVINGVALDRVKAMIAGSKKVGSGRWALPKVDGATAVEKHIALRIIRRIDKAMTKGWMPDRVGPCIPRWLNAEAMAVNAGQGSPQAPGVMDGPRPVTDEEAALVASPED
jgi:hypothetical protein